MILFGNGRTQISSSIVDVCFMNFPAERVGRVAQTVQPLATGWTIRGLNPGGGEIFRTCPDRSWCPHILLFNGYRVFSGGKERPVRDADPSSPSSAIGHERLYLYLYSPYGPYGLYTVSVPVQGRILTFLPEKRRISGHFIIMSQNYCSNQIFRKRILSNPRQYCHSWRLE